MEIVQAYTNKSIVYNFGPADLHAPLVSKHGSIFLFTNNKAGISRFYSKKNINYVGWVCNNPNIVSVQLLRPRGAGLQKIYFVRHQIFFI